jgi:hypothetical protein
LMEPLDARVRAGRRIMLAALNALASHRPTTMATGSRRPAPTSACPLWSAAA